MLKKILGIILIAALVLSAASTIVFAADANFATFNGTALFLQGNAAPENANKAVSLLITDKSTANIKFIYQFETDFEGKYNVKLSQINIDDIDNCKILLKTSDGNDVTYSLKNASYAQIYDSNVTAWFENGKYNTNVSIKNKYAIAGKYKAIVAFYNSDDSLSGCDIRDINVQKGDFSIDFQLEAPKNTKNVKVMLWEDLDNMVPMLKGQYANSAPNIFLISDSLCTQYGTSERPQTGWGECIGDLLTDCNVVNYALGGYTLKDLYGLKFPYRKDTVSQFEKMMNGFGENPAITAGDYVIISSNINDGTKYKLYVRSNGKLYKFSDQTGTNFLAIRDDGSYDYSGTIYTLESLKTASDFEIVYNGGSDIAEYKLYLNKMIDEIRQKGATPIVIGSTGVFDENAYKKAATEVAKSNDVTYADAGCIINKYYADLKAKFENDFYYDVFHLRKLKGDGLHYSDKGAQLVANTIANLLKKSNSALGKYVKDDIVPYIDGDADYGLGNGTFDKYYSETADRHFK